MHMIVLSVTIAPILSKAKNRMFLNLQISCTSLVSSGQLHTNYPGISLHARERKDCVMEAFKKQCIFNKQLILKNETGSLILHYQSRA